MQQAGTGVTSRNPVDPALIKPELMGEQNRQISLPGGTKERHYAPG